MKQEKIVLAGGCFWGVERYFQSLKGVIDTKVGYANSKYENPSYELVCTGLTKAAEAIEIVFNPEEISLKDLLDEYFKIIDPYSLNKQGNDVGTQYRTGIYYTNNQEKKIIDEVVNEFIAQHGNKPIAVEIEPLKNFFNAEQYHQDYLLKNPYGYCHIPIPEAQEGSIVDKLTK